MESLVPLAKAAIYILMALSVVAALGVVFLRNLFYAALALAAALIGIAGIYFALFAEFLAIVQILLYVGAVMTLVIFAIMMTQRLGEGGIKQHNRLIIPGMAAGIAFLTLLCKILYKTPWPVREQALQARVSISQIGAAFMGTYVFPFEVISVILIAALIGAIIIAKRDQP